MLKRVISALIWAPLLLGLNYFGGVYSVFLVSILIILALREFLLIGKHMGITVWYHLTTVFTLFWLVNIFLGNKEWMFSILVFWVVLSISRMALQYPHVKLEAVGFNFLAVFYSVVLFSYLYLLRQINQGITWTFLIFILVWATDIFAYLIGRRFGQHLLAPKVSPKKTLEGSLGGLLGSILVGLIFWYCMGGVSLGHIIVLSLIVGLGGQIGDLFESALKRSAGIKDSGSLIPGHGGILDRCDSLIFVLPLVYYYIVIFVLVR
ncbi:MAG: phosphatidate cytidylyltransferase [Desulfitobacteriaceae bacterium]